MTEIGHVVRDADAYEGRLRDLDYEMTEEGRALQVGEKQVSEQAAILERYQDLFTLDQLEALRAEEAAAAAPDAVERLYRLRKTCENGIVGIQEAPELDAFTNAELAKEVEFGGESFPLRSAQALLPTLDGYDDRESLGQRAEAASASLNGARLELLAKHERLVAELSGEPDPVARSERHKGVSFQELDAATATVLDATAARYDELRGRWLDALLGSGRADPPSSYHAGYVGRLIPFAALYSKARVTEVCLATLGELGFDLAASNIHTDLEDRPQKEARPCVMAADPPAVIHLITRPQGGLGDYQEFLHEAGHALHFAGFDPSLPFTFRSIPRDNALPEVFSFCCEAIGREPGWHARYFNMSGAEGADKAEATRFLDAFVFRRYAAKLTFELSFWTRFAEVGGSADGYAELLTNATGFVYPGDRYLADMDDGFYVADYLRAWIRAAQLRKFFRERSGDDWWRSPETGDFLRELFREGLRPSSEDIAVRLGFDPLDTGPLVAELNA
jgi:hypothetical protein